MWWRGRIGGTGTRGGPGGGGNSGGGWLGFQRKERVYRSRGPAGGGLATWGGGRRRGALDRGQETIISQIAANCLSRPRVD